MRKRRNGSYGEDLQRRHDGWRRNPAGTLARHGYNLTGEEMRMVEDLRLQTSAMTNEELARVLDSGLQARSGSPPVPPP